MGAVLFVRGEVRYGEWGRFLKAAGRYQEYRKQHGYVVPMLLQGMSGPMNSAVFVYKYDHAQAFEDEDRRISGDAEYGRVASEMPYREGTIVYELWREV
jgi:hypothetical protein